MNVTQPTTGGVAVCVRDLTLAGLEAGFDMTLVCPDDGPLGPDLRAAGATWEPLPMRRAPGPHDLLAVARLRPLLRGADVVHLHSSKAGAVGRLALPGRRRPHRPGVAYTPHGWGWLVGGHLAPAYRGVERHLAHRADAIVAVSDDDAQAGRAVLGRWSDRLTVIPNGVDTHRFSPEGPTADRDTSPLLVCVGRLSHQKAQDLALAALAVVAANDVRLRFVGDGPERAALVHQTARLGLADRVEFVGVADPSPHLRAADVVIVPSRWDAQSLSLLEAMATGRPVVATAVAGSGALGQGGAVVPVDDAEALARAIDSFLDDPARRRDAGMSGRATVIERHRLQQMTDATLGLWRSLARVDD